MLFYLWDGDNEIGAVDEKGTITQIRILGEGLGAEIGAAMLYELNGKTYVPIHNHRGDLVVLLDAKLRTPVETCRYTAFGEELIPAHISPWRFSSKRITFSDLKEKAYLISTHSGYNTRGVYNAMQTQSTIALPSSQKGLNLLNGVSKYEKWY